MSFYEDIAHEYADAVGQLQRRPAARAFVEALLARRPARRAIDAACGTGLFAQALAERGVEQVIGSDLSEAMLEVARTEADGADLDIQWVAAPMQRLPEAVGGTCDVLLCMGNSLPHLLTDEDLRATLDGFARLLAEDGLLAVQVLNYDRLLDRRERIVGVGRAGSSPAASGQGRSEKPAERTFVRFYDFLGDRVRFNLLGIAWRPDGTAETVLHSTELRPYRRAELTAALEASGFGSIEATAGLSMQAYDESTSDSLTLLARR